MKKVSIIIPYREDRGWLNEAIASVEKQSHPNIELLVIKGNYNCSQNINKGIESASGDFMKILAEDDWLTDDAIATLVNNIDDHGFIHANAYSYFSDSKIKKYIPQIKYPNVADLLRKNHIHGGTVLYAMKLIEDIGKFDENLLAAEEYEYHLRALSKGHTITYVDKFVCYYRRHSRNKGRILNVGKNHRKDIIASIKEHYQRVVTDNQKKGLQNATQKIEWTHN